MKSSIYLACILLVAWTSSRAGQIRVSKDGPCQSIQQALTKAASGDTIVVEKGIYREKNLVVRKPVTLIGEHFPTLDGEEKFENISVKADGVTIRGFRVIRSGISSLVDIGAIKIYNARNVVVEGNILEDDFFGIYVQAGVNCRILGNQLKASAQTEQRSGNGIHCWKCDSMQITDNRISGHRDGIYFEFVTNSLIWRNISTHNIRYGLHFMFSHNDMYVANIFANNSAGVSVMYSHGVRMFSNFFQDNWGDGAFGLLLKEITDSYVQGNKFFDNTSGIYMEGASRIEVLKNEFKGNGWAMKIQASCMDIDVTMNNFVANTFDVGTNGTLVLNTFNGNYWDKYEGYDLNRDGKGDVPFHPVSLFSVIVEKNPSSMMLFRSFMTSLLDKSERILPTLTPENLKDNSPLMKPFKL